jgi:DNA-binding Lrp family transcriptional regulator
MIPEKDMQLITYLRQDARAKLTTLSRQTRMPVSTIFEKLKSYHGTVFQKHVTLLNFASIGYHFRAYIFLRLDPKDKTTCLEYLKCHQNTNNLFKVTNGFDFMLESIFRDLKELESFVETLEDRFKVKGREMYYLIEEFCREAFLSKPELVGVV